MDVTAGDRGAPRVSRGATSDWGGSRRATGFPGRDERLGGIEARHGFPGARRATGGGSRRATGFPGRDERLGGDRGAPRVSRGATSDWGGGRGAPRVSRG